MSYTYSSLVTILAERLSVSATDADFLTDLPTIIDDAEQRCYRDLDLLATVVRDQSATTTANSRTFTLPTASGRFVVLDEVSVMVNSVRYPCVRASKEVIDYLWPGETAATASTIPNQFAMISDQTIIFGPPPGGTWTVECIGTIRPAALSASNTTTFLTSYLSDLFLAACMVSATGGLLRNYGAASDDPRMAISWDGEYNKRLASANAEEMRRRYGSSSWIAKTPQSAISERQ